MDAAFDYGNRGRSVLAPLIAYTESLTDEQAELKLSSFVLTENLVKQLANRLLRDGYLTTRAEWAIFIEGCLAYGPDDDVSLRLRRFIALNRDATPLVLDYIRDRARRHGGNSNVTVEVRGRTGSGKSSAALTICELLGMRPQDIATHVAYYAIPWLRSVRRAYEDLQADAQACRVVLLDEQTLDVGEGSRTKQDLMAAQEARLRETGVNMVSCRANTSAPMTRDVTLEMMGVNPARKETWGLAYMAGLPLGRVTLPWCSPTLWATYHPSKVANLDASVRLHSPDASIVRSQVLDVLLDRQAMDRIVRAGRNEAAVRMEIDDDYAGQYSTSQIQRMAERILHAARHLDDDEAYRGILAGLAEKGLAWAPEAEA